MNAAVGAVKGISIMPENNEKRIAATHRAGASHLVCKKADQGTTDRNVKDKW
jgi:hypothetical protein